MPQISNVILHPIQGSGQPGNSYITFDYTVTFNDRDHLLGTPYDAYAQIIGDDTTVVGDAAGGTDDLRPDRYLGLVKPNPLVQVLTATLQVSNSVLNEDGANGDTNSNPDEIRVRIHMTPVKAQSDVLSPESNLRTVSLV